MRSNILKVLLYGAIIAAASAAISGCKVKYSFSGASISPLAKTVSIAYFPNNAPMVAPALSSALTDALKDRFARQTKLSNVRDGGDLHFEGEIVGYTATPTAIAGGDMGAMENKLTITVKVRFTNSIEPHLNFDRTFSQNSTFDTAVPLQQAEGSLIPEIVEMLVEDIFNAAVANW